MITNKTKEMGCTWTLFMTAGVIPDMWPLMTRCEWCDGILEKMKRGLFRFRQSAGALFGKTTSRILFARAVRIPELLFVSWERVIIATAW